MSLPGPIGVLRHLLNIMHPPLLAGIFTDEYSAMNYLTLPRSYSFNLRRSPQSLTSPLIVWVTCPCTATQVTTSCLFRPSSNLFSRYSQAPFAMRGIRQHCTGSSVFQYPHAPPCIHSLLRSSDNNRIMFSSVENALP